MEEKFLEVSATPSNPNWEKTIAREEELYKKTNDVRSEFERDYDRILYSNAYRRLKHKTQVFFLPKNVYAKTTITVCNSGCDYSNFEEVEYAYMDGNLTDKELIVELGECSYEYNDLYRYINSLTINGVSKENTVLQMVNSNLDNLVLNNMSVVDNYGSISFNNKNVTLKNIIINFSDIEEKWTNLSLMNIFNINLENVTVNNNDSYSALGSTNVYIYFNHEYTGDSNVNINGLTINNKNKVSYGLVLDEVANANINNLTVNNTNVGLYVHRHNDYPLQSSVIVNNSNLSNNTCSSFNVLDDNHFDYIPMSNINNKNYQLSFRNNNKLNCAVASGYGTNTYISSNNVFSNNLNNYTYDEINYDNLTDTIQNINNGSVDIVSKYKGVITVEQGSSSLVESAFDYDVDLSSNITWTSSDSAIAVIDTNEIIGIKEGRTIITGVSDDGLNEYEIDVTVIKNPATNSVIYITIGVCFILILGTITYVVYTKRVDR